MFVKTMDGRKFMIASDLNETIAQFQVKVDEYSGVHTERQGFVYKDGDNETPLHPQSRFKDNNIPDMGTIEQIQT